MPKTKGPTHSTERRAGPTPAGKRTRTRQQRIKVRAMRSRGEATRQWMMDLLHAPKPPVEAQVRGGHGITRQLANIEPPVPQVIVKHYDDTSPWERRHMRLQPSGEVVHRTGADGKFGTTRDRNRRRKPDVIPAFNEPYVNHDRATSRKLRGRR